MSTAPWFWFRFDPSTGQAIADSLLFEPGPVTLPAGQWLVAHDRRGHVVVRSLVADHRTVIATTSLDASGALAAPTMRRPYTPDHTQWEALRGELVRLRAEHADKTACELDDTEACERDKAAWDRELKHGPAPDPFRAPPKRSLLRKIAHALNVALWAVVGWTIILVVLAVIVIGTCMRTTESYDKTAPNTRALGESCTFSKQCAGGTCINHVCH